METWLTGSASPDLTARLADLVFDLSARVFGTSSHDDLRALPSEADRSRASDPTR